MYLIGRKSREIFYKKLKTNYDIFWMSDSDDYNSIDPHDAILWFESNDFKCLSHPMHLKAFFGKTGTLVFRKIT
jgi:hypothetical protein